MIFNTGLTHLGSKAIILYLLDLMDAGSISGVDARLSMLLIIPPRESNEGARLALLLVVLKNKHHINIQNKKIIQSLIKG